MLPVSMWPGVAGAHAELQLGAHVLVEFIEGDRRLPIVTGFAGKDSPGFVPSTLTLCTTGPGARAAREGDTVRVTIPADSFVVSVSGSATGTKNPAPVEVDGEITSGSDKVKLG